MTNISNFVEKVIGAEMEIYHSCEDPNELSTEPFVIDTVDQQDDGTYNVISTNNTIVNMPTLDDIENAVDGHPYYLIHENGYSKIFRKLHKHWSQD